jgi:hypothetical protein
MDHAADATVSDALVVCGGASDGFLVDIRLGKTAGWVNGVVLGPSAERSADGVVHLPDTTHTTDGTGMPSTMDPPTNRAITAYHSIANR